jgi:hypothetical protein
MLGLLILPSSCHTVKKELPPSEVKKTKRGPNTPPKFWPPHEHVIEYHGPMTTLEELIFLEQWRRRGVNIVKELTNNESNIKERKTINER